LETANRQNKAIHGKISDFKVRRGTRRPWRRLPRRLQRPVIPPVTACFASVTLFLVIAMSSIVFSSHSRPVNRLYFNFSRQLACLRQLAISSLRALLCALFFSLFAIVPAPPAFFQPAQGVAL